MLRAIFINSNQWENLVWRNCITFRFLLSDQRDESVAQEVLSESAGEVRLPLVVRADVEVVDPDAPGYDDLLLGRGDSFFCYEEPLELVHPG